MSKTIYSKEHAKIIRKLKKARKEAGLDQEDVSKMIGKTQSYISKLESGQRRVEVVQLQKLAKIYKKPIKYFLN